MNVNLLFISLASFVFFIDSGGGFGIRQYILPFFLLLSFFMVLKIAKNFNDFRLYRDFLYFNFLFFIFIVYAIFISIVNDIDTFKIVTWVVPIFFYYLLMLGLSVFKASDVVGGFVISGVLFCIVINVVFFTALFLPAPAANVFLLNFESIPGWFYLRKGGFWPDYPNIYFQATLGLVPVGLLACKFNFSRSFIFIIFTLSISLSRFGVFILLLYLCYNYFIKNIRDSSGYESKLLQLVWLFLGYLILFGIISSYLFFYRSYTYNGDGFNVRVGHLVSIFNDIDWAVFLFGSGAGSEFFSQGFQKLTSNIEVSQLEVFRKYGLIGFLILHYAFFNLNHFFIKNKLFELSYIFVAFYIVCLSNPLLLTFNLSWLMCILSIICLEKKREYERKNSLSNCNI